MTQAGAKLVVVLGHTKCGAVTGACNHVKMGNLTTLLEKLKPAIDNETTVTEQRDGANPGFVNKVSALNVRLTIERIRKESDIISKLEQERKIKIVGGIYDVETGVVHFDE